MNMQNASYAVFAGLLASIQLAFELVSPASNGLDKRISYLFSQAKQHNVNAILRAKPVCGKDANRTLCNAYPLALYMAAPLRFKVYFVEKFPTDTSGLMIDYYATFGLKRLVPLWYPFESLTSIADAGSQGAINKLVAASTNADGVVAETLDESAYKILVEKPDQFYLATSRLTDASLEKLVCKEVHGGQIVDRAKERQTSSPSPFGLTLKRIIDAARSCPSGS